MPPKRKNPSVLRIRSKLDNGAPQSQIRLIPTVETIVKKEAKKRGRKRKVVDEPVIIEKELVEMEPKPKKSRKNKKETKNEIEEPVKFKIVGEEKDEKKEIKEDEAKAKKEKKKYKRPSFKKSVLIKDILSAAGAGTPDTLSKVKDVLNQYFPPPPPKPKRAPKPMSLPTKPHLQWLVRNKEGDGTQWKTFQFGHDAAAYLAIDTTTLYESMRLKSEKSKERLAYELKRVVDPSRPQPQLIMETIAELKRQPTHDELELLTANWFKQNPPKKSETKCSLKVKQEKKVKVEKKEPVSNLESDEKDVLELLGMVDSTSQLQNPPSPLNKIEEDENGDDFENDDTLNNSSSEDNE
jgi:hypothetical protein